MPDTQVIEKLGEQASTQQKELLEFQKKYKIRVKVWVGRWVLQGVVGTCPWGHNLVYQSLAG